METVCGLMLMLIAVCHGVETSCDGRQNRTQCFGALGGTVFIQMMNKPSEIYWFKWIYNVTIIFDWKNIQHVNDITKDRFLFIPSNGTIRINDLRRTDGGIYELHIFNSDGIKTGTRTLQLSVQAPVSSVQLVPQCLSQGQMKVSCSSEGGDSPQYSWTLDGHALTDSELFSVNKETNIVVLRQNVSGRLTCSVRNHVSESSKDKEWSQPVSSDCGFVFINCTSNGTHISGWVFEKNNTLCVEPTTAPTTAPHSSAGKTTESIKHSTINSSSNQTSSDQPWYIKKLPIVAGVLSALVLCLIVGISIICTQSKKTKNKAKEDDQELTYADVRIVQPRGGRMEQREEEGVEYGQIKLSEKPRQCELTDDAVYAKVRKTR